MIIEKSINFIFGWYWCLESPSRILEFSFLSYIVHQLNMTIVLWVKVAYKLILFDLHSSREERHLLIMPYVRKFLTAGFSVELRWKHFSINYILDIIFSRWNIFGLNATLFYNMAVAPVRFKAKYREYRAKSADCERTYALVGWFFPNFSISFRVRTKLLHIIQKKILRAIILSNKIFKILKTVAIMWGISLRFWNTLHSLSLTFSEKQIHHSKGFGKRNKILKSNFQFTDNLKFWIFSDSLHYRENRNLTPESFSSHQTLSNDVFVCPPKKNSKFSCIEL